MAQLVEIDPAGPLLCIDLDLLVRDPGPRPQVHNRARSATPLTYTLRVEQLSAMNPSASSLPLSRVAVSLTAKVLLTWENEVVEAIIDPEWGALSR